MTVSTMQRPTEVRHPDWCDLGGDCTLDAPTVTHRGRVSSLFSTADDAQVEVALEHPEDVVGGADHGSTVVSLTVTARDRVDGRGGPLSVEIKLDRADVEHLRHTLAGYTVFRRGRRDDGWLTAGQMSASTAAEFYAAGVAR